MVEYCKNCKKPTSYGIDELFTGKFPLLVQSSRESIPKKLCKKCYELLKQ